MKYITLLFVLCFNTFLFSQTNHFKIVNLSSHDISYVAVSMNLAGPLVNCVPIIYNEVPVVLAAGESSSFSQINDTYPGVDLWHFIGPDFEKVYDLSLGPISTADTDLVTWYQAIIYAPNGQQYTLGGGCMGGGVYSFTAGGITASLSFPSGVAYVYITD